MLVRDFARQDEPMAEAVLRFLEEQVLTEKRTDFAIAWAKQKLRGLRIFGIFPAPLGLVGRWLDHMLPERALDMIRDMMVDKGLVDPRRVHPDNPFRRQ